MKLKYLIIILILLTIVSGFLYYYSLIAEKEEPVTKEEPKEEEFVIKETTEVIEEVEQEGKKEQVVISDEIPETKEIYILRTIFSPKTLKIKKGTKVSWINKDDNVHQIKEISIKHVFRSDRLNPGGQYSFTFTEAGEYMYIDTVYTYMSGKIIVEESALGTITGNVIGFSKNQANVVTLLLFIVLGLTLIYALENYKKRKR